MDIQIRTAVPFSPTPLPPDEDFALAAAAAALYYRGTTQLSPVPQTPAFHRLITIFEQCGVDIDKGSDYLEIASSGRPRFAPKSLRIDGGDHSLLLRILLGIFASHPFPVRIEASGTARRRSLHLLITALQQMGVSITANRYFAPPLTIYAPDTLSPIELHHPLPTFRHRFPVALAALCASDRSHITEPQRRQLWDVLLLPGVAVQQEAKNAVVFTIDPSVDAPASSLQLPADLRLSNFALTLGLLHHRQFSLPQQLCCTASDSLLEFLCTTKQLRVDCPHCDPATLQMPALPIYQVTIDPTQLHLHPQEVSPSPYFHRYTLPFFTILCAFFRHPFHLRNAVDLRQMQSDWIAAIVDGLAGFGADIEEEADGFILRPSNLHGGAVDCSGDETIALAFLSLAMAIGDNSWLYNVPDTARIRWILKHFPDAQSTSPDAPSSPAVHVFD